MSQPSPTEASEVSRRLPRPLRCAGWAAAVLVVFGLGVLALSSWAVRQSRQVPEFYAKALEHSDQERREARDLFRQDVEQLQSDASKRGQWWAIFDEEQINAWLSDQLPEKFDRLLARGARDPAIAICDGEVMAAVRYKTARLDTVVSCTLTVAMTEEPNLLAVRLSNLKAGALPLPLEPFVRRISREAALGDVDIRWDFTDEGPVALVTIPEKDPRYVFNPVVIEAVDLEAGRLQVAGRTGVQAASDYTPRGPVHQFVSFRPRRVASSQTSRSDGRPSRRAPSHSTQSRPGDCPATLR